MIEREVTRTGKGSNSTITRLCGGGFSASKDEAIRQIEGRTHQYWVDIRGVGRVNVKVVDGPNGKYLRTDPDKTTRNNLQDLPDC